MDTSTLKQQIWHIVALIPAGKVATYGQVARQAGYPNHARFVGTTMKNLPGDTVLPWYRVVRGSGRPAFPPGSHGFRRQKKILEAEGIIFSDNRISLRRYQWRP